MKKFLKYISLILPIALVAIGCQSEPEYDFTPDTNKSGEITLEAAIENAASRASMSVEPCSNCKLPKAQ